jgi:hypothetical protein
MEYMKPCWPKKLYYVCCRWIDYPNGGGRNFIATPHLGRARYYAKRLPLKIRQIDVRIRGEKPYVLKNSWL